MDLVSHSWTFHRTASMVSQRRGLWGKEIPVASYWSHTPHRHLQKSKHTYPETITHELWPWQTLTPTHRCPSVHIHTSKRDVLFIHKFKGKLFFSSSWKNWEMDKCPGLLSEVWWPKTALTIELICHHPLAPFQTGFVCTPKENAP